MDRAVLITGSSGSIGMEIVKNFLRQGDIVFGIDKIKNVEDICQFIGDLENDRDLENSKEWINHSSSNYDVVINCAGLSRQTENNFDLRNFNSNLRINLEVPFLYCGLAIDKAIHESKPLSIINFTSLGAHQGFPFNPSYQISKAGLGQLTRSIAVDYGSHGIRANNLVPGYIKTSMTENSFKDANANRIRAERSALKRWGNTSDLVGAVNFLASEESAFVTGIDLFVDGGWNINGL
jgi:NAD(P)-dependent dehydrogenase (short-subunit alcohol dehydrogenase family)